MARASLSIPERPATARYRYELYLPVLLPRVGDLILEEHRVQPGHRLLEREVPEQLDEVVEACLAPGKVARLCPWRTGMKVTHARSVNPIKEKGGASRRRNRQNRECPCSKSAPHN